MTAVLVFGVALTAGILISGAATRSMLSTPVLFLVVGFPSGPKVLGLLCVASTQNLTEQITEIALFAVLFTDSAAGVAGYSHRCHHRHRIHPGARLDGRAHCAMPVQDRAVGISADPLTRAASLRPYARNRGRDPHLGQTEGDAKAAFQRTWSGHPPYHGGKDCQNRRA